MKNVQEARFEARPLDKKDAIAPGRRRAKRFRLADLPGQFAVDLKKAAVRGASGGLCP
jgi:hypothetical protein